MPYSAHVARPRTTIRLWSTASTKRVEDTIHPHRRASGLLLSTYPKLRRAHAQTDAYKSTARRIPKHYAHAVRRAAPLPRKGIVAPRLFISAAHAICPASVPLVRPPRGNHAPSRTGPESPRARRRCCARALNILCTRAAVPTGQLAPAGGGRARLLPFHSTPSMRAIRCDDAMDAMQRDAWLGSSRAGSSLLSRRRAVCGMAGREQDSAYARCPSVLGCGRIAD